MEDKRPNYIVNYGGKQYQLTEDEYNETKDDIFGTDEGATAVRFRDNVIDDEIDNNSAYSVTLDGKSYLLSPGEYREMYDDIRGLQGVKVGSYSPVDYHEERFQDMSARKKELENELAGLPKEEMITGSNARAIQGASINQMQADIEKRRNSPEARRRGEINKELAEINKEIDRSPAWQARLGAMEQKADEGIGSVGSMFEELDAAHPETAKAYKQRSFGRDAIEVAYAAKNDPDYARDQAALTSARIFYDDAKKLATAPSKYGDELGISNFLKGIGAGAPTALSIAKLAKELNNIPLFDAAKEIQDKLGDDVNISELIDESPERLEGILSPAQIEMLKAFSLRTTAEGARNGNLSMGYEAGKGFVQSLGYMADFLAFGKVADIPAEAVAGNLVKNTAQGSLGRIGAEALHGLIKSIAITPMMPSTYGNILESLARFDDKGQIDLSGKEVGKAVADAFVENMSETIGAKPLELLGWGVGKALPTDWLSKTQLGAWGKALRHTPIFNSLKQAGWNGFFEEMFEEVSGNAVRAITGIDKDALKNFMQWDQLLTTAASFAPMSLIGGIPSTARFISTSNKVGSSEEKLTKILSEAGYDQEDITKTFAELRDMSGSPAELGNRLAQLAESAVQAGANPAETAIRFQEYANNLASYKVMEGIFEEQEDAERANRAYEISTALGREDWSHEGEKGRMFVRTMTDANGNVFYVQKEDNTGTFLAIDPEGKPKYIYPREIQDGTYTDSGEMAINDFLDGEVQTRKKAEEQARMQTETAQKSTQLAQEAFIGRDDIPLGTEEKPSTGTIVSFTNGQYVVQDNTDGSIHTFTPEEMGGRIGIDMSVKTDSQLDEEAAKEEEHLAGMRVKVNDAIGASQSVGGINLDGLNESIPQGSTAFHVSRSDAGEYQLIYRDAEGNFQSADIGEQELNELSKRVDELPIPETPPAEAPVETDNDPLRINELPEDMSPEAETDLFNESPERWAAWNDRKRQDGGANSRAYLELGVKTQEKRLADLEKQYASEGGIAERRALEDAIAATRGRIQSLTDAIARREAQTAKDIAAEAESAEPVGGMPTMGDAIPAEQKQGELGPEYKVNGQLTPEQQAEEQRRIPLRERAHMWEQKTGTTVRLLESLDEVENQSARRAIKRQERRGDKRQRVTGWYEEKEVDGQKVGAVYLYLPHIENEAEVDKTYIHEVISHKGLKEMLQDKWEPFLDQVWKDLMTDKDRTDYSNYVLATNPNASGVGLQRAAADEFVAFFSENIDLEENQSLWDKFVNMVHDFLSQMIGQENFRMTKDDLANLLRASLARYKEIAANGEAKSPVFRIDRTPTTSVPNTESLPENIQQEMEDKGLVMEGGVVMDEAQSILKEETGYKTPNELDAEGDPEVGYIRFSRTTLDPWERNYMQYPGAEQRVVNAVRRFNERCAMDELVNNVVPQGEYKYGEKSSGSKAGPLRTNQEYIVTFDMDTSCPRSLQYLGYAKKIEAQIGRPLTLRESVQLIEMMRVYGQMIPCVYCYCENKRQALKQYYTNFMESRHKVLNAKTEEEALKAMYGHRADKKSQRSKDPAVVLTNAAYEVYKEWRTEPTKKYNPTLKMLWYQYRSDRNVALTVLDDMFSQGGITTMMTDEAIAERLSDYLKVTDAKAKKSLEEIVSDWKWNRIEDRPHDDFARVENEDDLVVREDALALWRDMTLYGKSASSAKNKLRYVPYTDELKTLKKKDRDYINGMGGLRMHSSNDFRIDYVLDYFQFMADMAVTGMFGHTYTKSPEFVRIFGNSGYKINMSIAAYEDSRGIRPNVDEGFDWTTAKELRELFPNAGVMLMATSDAQIQYALDNLWIDMCIPFHHSGLPKEVWYDMRSWTDYTSIQNERFPNSEEMSAALREDGVEIPKDADTDAIEEIYLKHFNIKVAVSQKGKNKGKRIRPHFLPGETIVDGVTIPGHNNDYETYMRLCREWGVHPRFEGIKVKDNSPEGGGREIDITQHPRYMIFIKETARTDTPQTAIQFNFDQPSEALEGRSPMEYALYELTEQARKASEAAGGPTSDIYATYDKDIFGIVPNFINGVINHEEEYRRTHNGEELPLDFLTPDSRRWAMTERRALQEAYKDVDTIPYHPHEYDADGNLIMAPEEQEQPVEQAPAEVEETADAETPALREDTITALRKVGIDLGDVASEEMTSAEAEEIQTSFRAVTDLMKIAELEAGPKVPKIYRSAQAIEDPNGEWEYDFGDGRGPVKVSLYAPMSAKVDGKWRSPIRPNEWEEAEERPDLADEKGKFKLNKGNGKGMDVAYAPYLHHRRSPLNEQFSEAWNRPNLVILEVEIPESELTSNYTAEKSKKSTGEHDWPSGKVSNALAKRGQDTRKVILSRWSKPTRLVPAAEVADEIVNLMGDKKLTFQNNVVTPSLRRELVSRGVKFSGWQGNKPDNVEEIIARMKAEDEKAENVRFRRGINKEMPATGIEDNSSLKVPVVTSTDANVINNLDNAIEKYQQGGNSDGFISDIGKAIGLRKTGSSQYGDVVANNGRTFTLRLSDHNATVSHFDNNKEDRGISIVISRKPSQGVINNGKANIEEFFYPDKSLRKAEGTPLADIAKAIKQSLYSGEYKDATGLAVYEEVNSGTMFRISNDELFDMAKERFGTTRDIREAGYILPDGTMLDFSGRHLVSGDASYLRGNRQVDHRDISDLNYERDLNTPSGIETDMHDFIKRGAIRIDSSGSINLAVKPTQEQIPGLRRLVEMNNGNVYLDFGDGWDVITSAWYEGARPDRVINEINRYFNEGVAPQGNSLRFAIRGLIGTQNAGDQQALDNLDVAKEMEEAGKDAASIWRATGWERGADGKWRNEIPDARPVEGVSWEKQNTAGDALYAPELFDSYPELKSIKIKPVKSASYAAAYDYQTKTITHNLRYGTMKEEGEIVLTAEGRRSLLHELQHAIQHIEGFAHGGSGSELEKDYYRQAARKSESGIFAWHISRFNSAQRLMRAGREKVIKLLENYDQSRLSNEDNDYLSKLTTYLGSIDENGYFDLIQTSARIVRAARKAGADGYKALAGEVEARNVETRSKVTEKNRAVYPPSASEDVPRADQIVRFRVSPQQDAEYLDAVNSGDMDKAQQMVEEAARKAGYTIRAYHGTKSENGEMPYTSITEGHFTDDRSFAEYYGSAGGGEGFVYDVFLKMENPYEYDFRGQNSDDATDNNGQRISTRRIFERAVADGYDGVILRNVDEYGGGIEEDGGEYPGSVKDYIPARPGQIKSAEPVTYDDNGEVISLSERFNQESLDIRFRVNSEQKLPDNVYGQTVTDADVEESTMFRLSRNNRNTVETWLKKREDISEEERNQVIDYIDGLDDAKTQLATARWFANGAIRLPEDMPKVEQAVSVASKAKVDPLQYDSPMALLDAHADFKPTEKRINPDDVPTLHKAAEYPEGVVVYDVDEGQESRKNMREIINTHFGKDASPWCLLQGDGEGNLTDNSKKYWKHYNAYPKQVAFKDGKLLAFSANDSHTKVWWDRQDRSHYGIPITKKIDGDELGRSVAHILTDEAIVEKDNLERELAQKYNCPPYRLRELASDEDIARLDEVQQRINENYQNGKAPAFIPEPGAHPIRGNTQNGVYEEWGADGETLLERTEYKDGKANGLHETWFPNGQQESRVNYKDDHYVGPVTYWYDNGQVRVESELDDESRKHGPSRAWYKNGNKRFEGSYNHGDLVGVQKEWAEDGDLMRVQKYSDEGDFLGYEEHGHFGIEKRVTYTDNGRIEENYYRNGSLSSRVREEDGKSEGLQEYFYPDGTIHQRSNYHEGERHGLRESFHPNGQLSMRGNYENGKREGVFEHWSRDGVLNQRTVFKNDEVVEGSPFSSLAFRIANENQEIFVSNAAKAVEGIQNDKATPEQWLKQLEKNGGLKAGEDKWIGLSDWLKASQKKTLTKQEVQDYINQNKIQIEEVRYADAEDIAADGHEWNEAITKRFGKEVFDAYNFEWDDDREVEVWIEDEDKAAELYNKLHKELGIEHELFTKPTDDYYTSVDMRWLNEFGLRIAQYGDEQMEKQFGKTINPTRIDYTTINLDNKREIALTVPTIEPWRTEDKVHFGDAGEGRAIAWIRFGETRTKKGKGDAPLRVNYVGEEPQSEARRKAIDGLLLNWNDNESYMRNERPDEQFYAARAMFENSLRDNYREMSDERKAIADAVLAELPNLRRQDFKPIYEEGKRVLVIDEIQSKRHQEGREKGYMSDTDVTVKYDKELKGWNYYFKGEHRGYMNDLIAPTEEEALRLAKSYYKKGVPAAPFEKNWHELAMKRMLRYAAENGYDAVAWTTGDQQADRYNLSSQVSKIEISRDQRSTEDKSLYEVFTYNSAGNVIDEASGMFNSERLGSYFGKELAVRLAKTADEKEGELVTIKGEGLKVGGEGMKGFYDEILPRFMNKYGKKWGVSVKDMELPIGEVGREVMHSVEVTPEMKESVMEGQPMFRMAPNGNPSNLSDRQWEMVRTPEFKRWFGDWENDPENASKVVDENGEPRVVYHGTKWNPLAEKPGKAVFDTDRVGENFETVDIDWNFFFTASEASARGYGNAVPVFLNIRNMEVHTINERVSYEMDEETGHDIVVTAHDAGSEYDSVSKVENPDGVMYTIRAIDVNEAENRFHDAIAAWEGEHKQELEDEYNSLQAKADDLYKQIEDEYRKLYDELGFQSALNMGYDEMKERAGYVVDNVVLDAAKLREGVSTEKVEELQKQFNDNDQKMFKIFQRVDIEGRPTYEEYEQYEAARDYHNTDIFAVDDPNQIKSATDNNGEFSTENDDIRFRVTPEQDAEYMEAVNNGDMEKAQRMVRDAAALAMPNTKVVDKDGKPMVVYHAGTFGIKNGRTAPERYMHFGTKEAAMDRFKDKVNRWFWYVDGSQKRADGKYFWDIDDFAFVFGEDSPEVKIYEKLRGEQPGYETADEAQAAGEEALGIIRPAYGRIVEGIRKGEINDSAWEEMKYVLSPVFLNLTNPERVEDQGDDWSYDYVHGEVDGFVYKNEYEDLGSDSYVAFSPNQVKSAEPVTYDDNGKVVPLSERFKEGNDIRFRAISPVTYEQSEAGIRESGEQTAQKLGIEIEGSAKGYRDANEAVKAATHQAVGQKGLRQVLGDEGMRQLTLDIFRNLPQEARETIADTAIGRNGGNISASVEEYLANRAEDLGDGRRTEERELWGAVSDALSQALSSIGIDVNLNEGDARWMMWQSRNADRQGDMINEVKRQVVANRLGFSRRQQERKKEGMETTRFRTAESARADHAARAYNFAVNNVWKRLRESFVDQYTAVNELVKAIEKATGKVAESFEDIRVALNQQGSKALAKMNDWITRFNTPMWDAIKDVMKAGEYKLQEVERYVMIKHGLERNEVFAKRDAKDAYQAIHDKAVREIRESDKTADEKDALIQKEDDRLERNKRKVDAGTDKLYLEFRERDYGGLTGLYSEYDDIEPKGKLETDEEYAIRQKAARHPKYTKIVDGNEVVDMEAMEEAARMEVERFERYADGKTDALWERINAATKETLKQQYEANIISRAQYTHVRDMFKFYVPLRGFEDTTAENLYDYYNSDQRQVFTAPLQRAKGRKTQAESPFGFIAAAASSGIAQDMKNESKLALYYFVANRKDNGVVSVSETWFEKVGEDDEGKAIFEPVFPPFNENLSTEEAKERFREWERSMQEKAAAGLAYKGTKKLDLQNVVVHINPRHEADHVITFKLGGKDMFMYVNGNPRAAQAINNELNYNAESSILTDTLNQVLRTMAALNTQLNPEFWISNFQRDVLFALMSVNTKEGGDYTRNFRHNLVEARKVVKMKKALEKGTLGDSYDEQLYREFVENGGVTGYTVIYDNEYWEKRLDEYAGKDRNAIATTLEALKGISEFGEAIEQLTRFAAFKTSREAGKDIMQSIADAKELTVNFNRKGSGKAISLEEAARLTWANGKKLNKTEQIMVSFISNLSPYGRRFIMFFNASIQGLNAMVQLYKKNPRRAAIWCGGYLVVGMMNAILHALVDDDDDYLDIPDWERRNNMLLGVKNAYLKWALPQEARVFYGLGDMVVNHAMGRSPNKNIVGELLSSLGEVAPIDFPSGIGAFTPSAATPIVEVVRNEDYKGARVYNEHKYYTEEQRKNVPAYRDPLANTGGFYIALSKVLNAISGGDDYSAGAINLNPNIVEHLVEGYTGGTGTSVEKLLQFFGDVTRGEIVARNTPFLRRMVSINDERYRNSHTTDLYYYYQDEVASIRRQIKEATKNGDDKKLDKLYADKRYEQMLIFDSYDGLLKYYNDALKLTDDENERRSLMREQDAIRKQMIQEISEIGKTN